MARRQPPVVSPIAPRALGSALLAAALHRRRALPRLEAMLGDACDAPRVVLTDSGTAALVLALRLAAGEGRTVALPGYACVDLAAAARFAGVRVRLYDLDPHTLGPDLDSVAAVLTRGVDAVVVAHLYGMPADVRAVEELAARHGVPVIEDAAQAAGGALGGRPLGALAGLSILSFGRGKGLAAGHGGALLVRGASFLDAVPGAVRGIGRPGWGWRDLATATAQWSLGRPSLYGIPASLPWLQLGEMVYHPAHEPRSLSIAAAALARHALVAAPAAVAERRRNAQALEMVAIEGGDVEPIRVIEGGASGYLRFPVLDGGGRVERPELGIVRGYPRTLHEQMELRPCLAAGEPATPGAVELRRSLFTLPTHGLLRRLEFERLSDWLRVPTRVMMTFAPSGRREGTWRSA